MTDPTSRPRISAVIATAGRPEILRHALAALLAADPAPFEILVVDGDAARSAEAVVDELGGGAVRYLATERGLTRQRNRALEACEGDVVAFFDDDARVTTDLFARLAAVYADPGIVGATGLVVEPASNRVGGKESRIRRLLPGGRAEGRFTRYGYPNRLVHVDVARDVEFMQGAFMTARLDAARKVRFDEDLPGYGLAEDEDFSYRLSRLGRVRYEPSAVVHHDNLGFGSRDTRAFGHQVVANRAYLLEKNFHPTATTWLQFGSLLAILTVHRLLNRDLAGARGVVEGAWRLRSRRGDRTDAGALRVAFVSSHAQLGGSELYLERLLAEIDGDDVAGVVLLEDGPFAGRLAEAGVTASTVPTGARPWELLDGARRLRAELRRRRPSVVHANGVKAALVATAATVGTRTPVVWVKHDFSWDGPLARLIARRCRDVVGVSAAVVAGLPHERVHVVHPGIALAGRDRDAARDRLRRRLGTDGPHLVLVGRLHPVKGHLQLLDVLPTVACRHPGVCVALVGGDDPSQPGYAADLRRRLREPDLGGRAVLLGHVDDAADIVAGADILVVPSVEDERGMGREGFGLAALEAMALGTPVVGYADGAVPEVVGPCGRLVPPGDRAALGQAILDLLDDAAERERLAACGLERARTEFTVERWTREMLDRYRAASRS